MSVPNLMYLIFGMAVVNGVISVSAVAAFLSHRKAITSYTVLTDFKKMVRQQMYQALLQMILLGGGCIIGIYGLIIGKVGLLLIIILNGIIFAMGMASKQNEQKARSLPVDDPAIEKEYNRICDSWVHRPFPDF